MKNSESEYYDAGVLSTPLSFVHSGVFRWENTELSWRGGDGHYWSLRSSDVTGSNRLVFYNTYLSPQANSLRGNGFAVRCIASGGLAPDSICPKGWQLPTYSGDKSFTNLINTSYSMKNDNEPNPRDSGVLSNPLSFLRSGDFSWDGANPSYRSSDGNCWSLRSRDTAFTYYMDFFSARLIPQFSHYRGHGLAVRCELHSSFLELLKDFLKVFQRGH